MSMMEETLRQDASTDGRADGETQVDGAWEETQLPYDDDDGLKHDHTSDAHAMHEPAVADTGDGSQPAKGNKKNAAAAAMSSKSNRGPNAKGRAKAKGKTNRKVKQVLMLRSDRRQT